jgi:hypothetical protein
MIKDLNMFIHDKKLNNTKAYACEEHDVFSMLLSFSLSSREYLHSPAEATPSWRGRAILHHFTSPLHLFHTILHRIHHLHDAKYTF